MIESKPYMFLRSIFFALSILMPDISYPIIGNFRPEDFTLILLGLFVLDDMLLSNSLFPRAGWLIFVMLLVFTMLVTVPYGINFLLFPFAFIFSIFFVSEEIFYNIKKIRDTKWTSRHEYNISFFVL